MNIPGAIQRSAESQAEHLVNYLALRRDGLGIPRAVLAQRIGVGERELRDWEMGLRQPFLAQLVAWMVALGLNAVFASSALADAAIHHASPNNEDWIAALERDLLAAFREEVVPIGPMTAAAKVLRHFGDDLEAGR